jgi:hypothetical protein
LTLRRRGDDDPRMRVLLVVSLTWALWPVISRMLA